ncbi:MAG: DUF4340 domain-containing protein [Candidatus Poribacteria bacterium]|nr:DUF4340 domain-containing protein [Candidatus Poribacteria bacterium]
MNRRNQILAAVAVVQVVIAVFVFWRPGSGSAQASAATLFDGISADDISTLMIEDAEGKTLKLAKKFGEWTLPDAGDFPADSTKVGEIVEKIVALKKNRPAARTEISQKQLKVDKSVFERRVTLSTSGGERTLLIGSAAGSRAAHVRNGSKDDVYLANDLTAWQIGTGVSPWIDTAYVDVPGESVKSMTLTNGQGSFSFVNDSGAWTMAGLRPGETLDATKVSNLVNRIASLRMVTPLGKESKPFYGLDSPSATVTLATESMEGGNATTSTHTIQVGAKDDNENQYTVKASDSEFIVRVGSYSVEDFVTYGRADFLKKAE